MARAGSTRSVRIAQRLRGYVASAAIVAPPAVGKLDFSEPANSGLMAAIL